MIALEIVENPKLKRLVRDFSVGEFLFEEGYLGDALYLIIEGTVCVYRKVAGGKRLLHTAIGGDLVGEKALIAEPGFKRDTSAQAKTSVVALEVDRRTLTAVSALVPDLWPKMLKSIQVRLDETLELFEIVFSKNDVDRVTQYIPHFFKYNKKLGKALQITVDDITLSVNCDVVMVQRVIEDLVKKKILRPTPPGYTLVDGVALVQYAPELRERLAA